MFVQVPSSGNLLVLGISVATAFKMTAIVSNVVSPRVTWNNFWIFYKVRTKFPDPQEFICFAWNTNKGKISFTSR